MVTDHNNRSSSHSMSVSEDQTPSCPNGFFSSTQPPLLILPTPIDICPSSCWPVWTYHPSVCSDTVPSFTSPHQTRWILTLWPDSTANSSCSSAVNCFTPRVLLYIPIYFPALVSWVFLKLLSLVTFLLRMSAQWLPKKPLDFVDWLFLNTFWHWGWRECSSVFLI